MYVYKTSQFRSKSAFWPVSRLNSLNMPLGRAAPFQCSGNTLKYSPLRAILLASQR
jgi:hypothetical protein